MKLLMVVLFSFALTACTLVPQTVQSATASYDGNAQNSGVISLTDKGAVVTQHFRDRYNALIAVWGKLFAPRLDADAGMTRLPDGSWLIDREHLIKMIQMNAWRKSGRITP